MDFPGGTLVPLADDRSGLSISTYSGWSLGPCINAALASTAWPATNRALFVPFRVPVPVTVYKMATATGTLTTGNFDLGIYDSVGTRIVSSGTTAKTTASSERIVDVTDTLLLPGLYYLAMSVDGTGAYLAAVPISANIGVNKILGMRQMASAFVLPATATFASITTGFIPMIGAYLRPE